MKKYLLFIISIIVTNVLFAQAPLNDNCTNATPVIIPASGNACVTSSLLGATDDGFYNGCEVAGSKEVWFTFTATGSGNTITVSPTGATPATNLVVSVTSSNCASSVINTCNAAATANGTATANWTYPPGTQVWVFVSSTTGSTGGFQLCVTSVTPPATTGKSCVTAAPICSKATFSATIASGSNGYQPPCFTQALQQPLIFKFTVGTSGLLNWLATPSCGAPNANATEFDWAVYNITAGCPGTVVACDYNYTGGGTIFFPIAPTTTPQGMQGGPGAGCNNTTVTGTTGPEICTGVNVTSGNTYIIILDQYTLGSTCSVTLDFTGSTFTMAPTSVFTVTPDSSCSSITAVFGNTSIGAVSQTWSFGDGSANSAAVTPPNHTYNTPGTYLVSLTTTSTTGCQDAKSHAVQVFPTPTVTATATNSCSAGGNATLTANPSIIGGTYLWSPGGANTPTVTVTPATTTTYTVTYNLHGCTATATATVNVGGLTVNAGTDSVICANQTILLNGTVTPAVGNYTYAWTPNSTLTNANTLTPSATPLSNTTYTLSVTDANGCSQTDVVQISISGVAVPVTATVFPSVICPGQQVQLNATVLPVSCGASPPCAGNNITSSIGAGTSVQPGTSLQSPTLFGNFLKSGRNQMLYTAAELNAALGSACILKAVTFNIAVFNSNAFLQNFVIKMACTNLNSLTNWEQNLTTVYTSVNPYQPQAGWLNGIALTTPFAWDGVSNLIIDICWNNPATFGNQNNKAECTTTGFTSYLYSFSSASDQCGTVAVPTTSTLRPNVKFNYCSPNISNYTVVWTPSTGANAVSNAAIANPTANPIATTNYNISVSNGGCAGTDVVTVTVDNSTLTAGPDKNSCPNVPVALTATVGGSIAPGPATFVWTTLAGANVGNTQTVNITPAVTTTYIVTMNGGSCVKKDTIVVNIGSLTPTATPTNATCFGANNGKILAASATGTTPFTFLWSANAATGNIDSALNLAPANYQVTVTDATGCTGSASATITQPTQVTFSSATINDSCFGGTQGSITITPNGGTGAYTYTWSNALPSTQTVSSLVANTYSVTVRDANLCSATAAMVVTEPTAVVFLPAVIQDVRCFGGNTGKITVSNSGGTGAYSYSWSNNAGLNSPVDNNLIAGAYTVTVADANGCTTSATYNVAQPATGLTFGASNITPPTCFGASDGTATVNPSGGVGTLLYLWTPSNQTTQTATALSAQNYTVVVTDDSLCTATTTITVTQPTQIQIAGVVTNVGCNGASTGSIDITVTNGVPVLQYAWSFGGITTQDISNLPAAPSYSVTVTDANSCTAIATYPVTEPAPLALNPASITDVLCKGANTGAITIIYTGGIGTPNFTWSPAGPNSATNSNLIAGNYSVTLTDVNLCSITATYSITEPANAVAFGTPVIVDVLCNGGSTGSITVSVNGGTGAYSYSWSHNTGLNNATASSLTAGPYTVTVTDANGCTLSSTNNINQPTAVTFGAQIITNVSCFGRNDGIGEITPTGGTGAYNYTWNGVAGSNPQTGLVANTYNVVVTDANNCPFPTTVIITQPLQIVVAPTATNALCFGASDGSVSANASGGSPAYIYLWSNGGGNVPTITSLPSGLYTVTVTDSKGCSASSGANVNEPSAVIFNTQVTQVKCPGDMNGTITTFPSGGTPPYSFSATQDGVIFFFPTNGVILGLASGSYIVSVNDANGCKMQNTVFVPAPLADTYNVITDSTSCYGATYTDGALHVFGQPIQNGPFSFAIDGGNLQFSDVFYNLKAGNHQLLAQNNFGCTTTINAIVPEPQDATTEVLPSDTTLDLGESIQLSSTFGPYLTSTITSYSWSPATGLSCIDCPNPIATPYGRQTQYILTITYNGHCTATASMTILVDGGKPVYIPNTFSPNGDGNNDVFQIYGEGIKTIALKIFNRWGEKVYETNNQFSGWDGTYKGLLQNPSVFVYEVDITYLNDKKILKVGSITLLK